MSKLKSQNKEFSKFELNEENKYITKNKSILQAKELIKTLLKNTLNVSLLKLESNAINHLESLKISSKSFKEFSKLLNNININIVETKKKKFKEREKKAQIFKKGRKMITEYNFNSRSKTIEANLMTFKNKVINIDGKKNISKLNKKQNIMGHKLGNKTMLSFRNINEIEKEQDNNNPKLHGSKNISLKNTSQNFRKVKHKIIPATPVIKLRDKEKTQILAKAIKSKNINYKGGRNTHSRTVIISRLADIEENNENPEKNKNNYNQKEKYNKKNVKRIIYKNDSKSKDIRINYKTETINEFKNKLYNRNNEENLNKTSLIKSVEETNKDTKNTYIFNSSRNINKNIKIRETNELKNIVKLVDDVNENLNKLLKENNSNNNRKKSFVKEIKFQNQSTNALITAIKDVKIKELQNNSLELTEHSTNTKNNKDNKKINISKSYSLNLLHKKEHDININEKNIIKLFRNMFLKDDIMKGKKNSIKNNRGFLLLGWECKLFDNNSVKIENKSTDNIFKKSKYNKIKEKNNVLIENMEIQTNKKSKLNNCLNL